MYAKFGNYLFQSSVRITYGVRLGSYNVYMEMHITLQSETYTGFYKRP